MFTPTVRKKFFLKSLNGQKIRIQRYKGLGDEPGTAWQNHDGPQNKNFKKITIEDIQEADHTLICFLGKEFTPPPFYPSQRQISGIRYLIIFLI